MSGGYFDYDNDRAARAIFGWGVDVDYGLGEGRYYAASVREARRRNPFQDKQLSELAYDLFCLLHSLDWYISDDTGEETYKEDLAFFKNKWLKPNAEELTRAEIEKSVSELREDLFKTLGISHQSEEETAPAE